MTRWIQKAIKRPGALRRRAAKAHQLTQDGTIRVSYLRQLGDRPGRVGQQARLALKLRKIRRRR